MNWINNSNFVFGEISDRLTGMRDSQYYQQSANKIVNATITELGTLKASKKYDKTTNALDSDIKFTVETEHGITLVITHSKILSFDNTNTKKHELAHGISTIDENTNHLYFDNKLWIYNKWFSIANDGTIATLSNPLSTIKPPIDNKKNLAVDIYEVMQVGADAADLRIALLQTIKEPILETDSTGKIKITGAGMTINRIYTGYKPEPLKENFDGLVKGEFYMIFHNYKAPQDGSQMMIGSTPVTLEDGHDDANYGGKYYTKVNVNSLGAGDLVYGKAINFLPDIVDMCIFQNRLVVATKDTLYYSASFNKNNFENGIESGDAFYLKPSTINNNQANIMKLDSALGIWASTDQGIFCIGYNIGMSPKTSVAATKIATDIAGSKNTVLIDDLFYYIDNDGILRAIQATYDTGAIAFVKSRVEKYRIDNDIKYISRAVIDNEKVLIGATHDNIIYVYDKIDTGVFRCRELEIGHTGHLVAHRETLFNGKDMYVLSDNNYKTIKIKLNPPLVQTKNGGIIMNDYTSRIKEVVLNMLNQNKEIESVLIDGKRINNLSTSTIDRFGLFKWIGSTPFLDGLSIEINLKGTNNHVEIRLISMLVDAH